MSESILESKNGPKPLEELPGVKLLNETTRETDNGKKERVSAYEIPNWDSKDAAVFLLAAAGQNCNLWGVLPLREKSTAIVILTKPQ